MVVMVKSKEQKLKLSKYIFSMSNYFRTDDLLGDWMYCINVPEMVNYTLCCSGNDLFTIPLKNATIIGEHFYCYMNSLFCLDFCPLIVGLTVYHESISFSNS